MNAEAVAQDLCNTCLKPPALCVCAAIEKIQTRRQVLILQHPQEPDKLLGTAQIAHCSLPNSKLKVGLSWRNLAHALGREADPKRWAVLYLGSAKVNVPRGQSAITLVDKKGAPLPDQTQMLSSLDGIIALDGTWSQAKTLWWRNAWLLKVRRLVVSSAQRSLYMKLRKEPRAECLSTIESISVALSILEKDPTLETRLLAPFRALLEQYAAKGR